MKWVKRLFSAKSGANNKSQSIEEANRQLAELRDRVRTIKQSVRNIAITEAAEYCLPMANLRLDELRKYNAKLESSPTPEILTSCLANMEANIAWFAEQEELYPNAPWLMVGGAKSMLDKVKCRYNELLYGLAKTSFDRYKIVINELITEDTKTEETEIMFSQIESLRGFVDTTASNYSECFEGLNNLHNQVEDLYS